MLRPTISTTRWRAVVRIPLRWRSLGAVLAMTGACASAETSPTFPDRPVRLIVAFTPGTGSDALARAIAPAMARALGQPVVVDNRSGAGGIIGTEEGARAPADGYTMTLGTTSTLLASPALHPGARYGVESDFAPVGALSRSAFVIVTANRPDSPRDIGDLRVLLRGGNASFASSGVGTIGHLAAETLLKRLSTHAVHVPYRGSVEAIASVAGEQELFAIDTVGAAQPLIRAGRLRALAVTADARLASLPDVPTVHEADIGFLRLQAWWGLVVPAGTPTDRIGVLWHAAAEAMADPQVKAQLALLNQEPMALAPADFAAMLHTEAPRWREFVRKSGATE